MRQKTDKRGNMLRAVRRLKLKILIMWYSELFQKYAGMIYFFKYVLFKNGQSTEIQFEMEYSVKKLYYLLLKYNLQEFTSLRKFLRFLI